MNEIIEKQIRALGFVLNKEHEHPSFDEWVHKDFPCFGIGDFNGQGYLVDGIDWHEPITKHSDLEKIVSVLTRQPHDH